MFEQRSIRHLNSPHAVLPTADPSAMNKHRCPGCESGRVSIFHELNNVPVHSVSLVPTRSEALNFPRGDIVLGACLECGFVYNTAFDPARLAYHADYESTQAYSSTFNAFNTGLARRLIERYGLHDKKLIEIGCGHGEFLTQLCGLGPNRGIGFDPAYRPERSTSAVAELCTFIQDYYSPQYAHHDCDFLCCKMTLEHIQDTAGFVATVRASLGARADTSVFFQVPNARRVLCTAAFWDIYYEHCSYFTASALRHLFQRCGFEVVETTTEYDDQYLMIQARPGAVPDNMRFAASNPEPSFEDEIAAFKQNVFRLIGDWQQKLDNMRRAGKRVVVWGGGSKAVAFLTTLGVDDAIEYAVDINPHKTGSFLAGSGQEVVAPTFLKSYRPDVVLVMNPVYCNEIQTQLADMGVTAELIPVENH